MISVRKCRLHIETMLSAASESNKASLNLALQSVAKRSQFATLHFHLLDRYTLDENLILERLGIRFTAGGDVVDNRTQFEANTYALAQNLHAACDSFPLALTLCLGDIRLGGETLSHSRLGWNKKTYDGLVSTFPQHVDLHRQFCSFAKDRDFLILKGLVNQSKHQFLVRILNLSSHIAFESIRYYPHAWKNGPRPKGLSPVGVDGMAEVTELDVKHFMRRCHNRLFPKLFMLFWRLHEARLQDVEDSSR